MSGSASTDVLIVRRPQVVAADLAGGLALLDVASSQYFRLNPVGAHVWRLLDQPARRSEVLAGLIDHFEVDPGQCGWDLDTLLEDLTQAGLVDVKDE